LDEYKTSLINEFGEIKDSFFIKSELSDIDKSIANYISRQEKLSKYGKDVRIYKMETKEAAKKFNFFAAIDSLNSIEFNDMLKDYSDKFSALLSKVTDKDFIITEKERIEKTTSSWGERKTAIDNMPKEGEPAIDFTYPDKDGNEFSLSSFKGNLVYVDVWATWCGPCLGQIPALQKLGEEYHGKNITFLSVSVDNDKEAWLEMVDEKELGGIQLWADGWSGITKSYAIFGIPRFMLFSADGNVISTNAPRPTSDEIRGLLDSNL
jgi:thiol-disulfide isomerase/thioredoxin